MNILSISLRLWKMKSGESAHSSSQRRDTGDLSEIRLSGLEKFLYYDTLFELQYSCHFHTLGQNTSVSCQLGQVDMRHIL